MPENFNLQFTSESEFTAEVDSNASLDAEFADGETFTATMDDDSELFGLDFDTDEQMSAEFGTAQQIDTARVTSVNGQLGDVVIHVPSLVSELENDEEYIPERDVATLSNMELEAMLV